MVGPVMRSSLFRNSTVRQYAVAATAQSCCGALETKVLSNKVTVAACDNNSPIAQVSIVFRAGSRNETYDNQGTAHYLRIAAGLGTSTSSAFAITRNIQQLGGNLIATLERETLAYTLQINKDNLDDALPFLECAATKQVFKPWEVSDQLPRLKAELAALPETAKVIEMLHKAAYRNGLGNSLFAPESQLGKIGSETLQHFFNTWCTAPRCAVVGTGVSLGELSALASNLSLSPTETTNQASKYFGGELRKETASDLTNVALAVEGVSLKSEKDALACAVLQRATGSGPRVKWGNSASPLTKEVASVAGSEPFGLLTFNANYSDSGLFGIVLCSQPDIAGSLLQASRKWLQSMKLSDNDVARGKSILKTEVLDAGDGCLCTLESMQQQAIQTGKVISSVSLASDIDKITASDVRDVATKISRGKLSMAAVGNLRNLPYLDEL